MRKPYKRTEEHKKAMREKTKNHHPERWIIEKGAAARRGKHPGPLVAKIASERWRGQGNPKWNGGTARNPYGKNWQSQRQKVIKRDKTCQDCGEWNDKPHGMHVHHLDNDRKNNKLFNLLLLCQTCHYARHWRKQRVKK